MRVLIAGTGSGVGKTTIATGIMKALSRENNVQGFKAGPDYIDPTYHTLATGNDARNLDSFFMSPGQIRDSFLKASENKLSVIEGVRGLYEGIDPIGDIGSTASIAKALDAPVILIVNAKSLTKSTAAIVLGFKTLDPSVNIAGVILNKVKNKRHYLKAKESVEKLAKVEVIGGIPRNDSIFVKERHLGLVPAVEEKNSLEYIERWEKLVWDYIDVDKIKEIMSQANKITKKREPIWEVKNKQKVKIAIARDEVFNFYYKENIESLEANKAKIQYFSPLNDEELPDADAVYIGGGHPEYFSKELSKNKTMLKSIFEFHHDNHPLYAECGGLLYLMTSLNDIKMTNVFPYSSEMTEHVQGLSYVISEVKKDNIISKKGEKFHGHEFHYSKVNLNSNPDFAFDILRGTGIKNNLDGLIDGNTLASYVHTHVAALPDFPVNFIESTK